MNYFQQAILEYHKQGLIDTYAVEQYLFMPGGDAKSAIWVWQALGEMNPKDQENVDKVCKLYAEGEITEGYAAQLSGLYRIQFRVLFEGWCNANPEIAKANNCPVTIVKEQNQ